MDTQYKRKEGFPFYEKNKFVNCLISFKLDKKKFIAYPIYIEEPEDTNEYLYYID